MKTGDFHPRSWLAEASGGLVSGFRRSVLCLAMAAVLYGGVLTPFVGVGATLLLLGAAASMMVLALQSSFAGASGGPQDTPAAILFAIAAAMSVSTFSTDSNRMFATTVAVLVLACLLFGTLTYLVGRFRLGRFVQFLPYPVIGGFMAGTAWLLFGSAIKAMTDMPLRVENLSALVQPGTIERWVPAAAAGLLLFVLMRRLRHALTLPATLLFVVVIFYAIAASRDLGPVELRASGWLMAGIATHEIERGADALSLGNVDMVFIVSVLPALLTLVALSTIQTLLNVTALEVATGHELDADTELRVTGLSNLLTSPFGGLPRTSPLEARRWPGEVVPSPAGSV
jgi:sulfate permease, SulP family